MTQEMEKSYFTRIRELFDNKKYLELKEQTETDLVEKGYIKTNVFGWVSLKGAEWLNNKLRVNGYRDVESINGIPAYRTTQSVKEGNKMVVKEIHVVEPFIDEYYKMFERKEY